MFTDFADKIEKIYVPFSGNFELTFKCNLKCRFCYQYKKNNGSKELSTKKIKKTLDELAGLGCLFLSFTGGEPLLREDFWDISGHASKRNFAVTLQTNGILIDDSAAKKISKLNFYDVHISLLGGKAETQDWFSRTPGSFNRIINAIDILRKHNIRVVIKVTLMEHNFSELKDINKIAKQFGCNQMTSPIVSAKNDGDKSPCDFRIGDFQMKEFYSLFFKNFPKRKKTYMTHAGENMINCSSGKTTFCINPAGKVYPCVALPVPIGNIRDKGFSRIWWGKGEFLNELRKTKTENLQGCSKCKLLSLCVRCKGMAYVEDGNILSPSKEACRITNIIKEVIENEKEKV